jgi:hypothetical protein
MAMTRWQELTECLAAHGHEATESERRLAQDSLDTALDAVLSEGRALIASLSASAGDEHVDRVNRLSEDDLRCMAYAAARGAGRHGPA